MARILSSPWQIIRGSIGGTTYFANQYHQIVARARTAPVQPNTTPQALIRSVLNDAADQWNQLTQGERNAWETYAAATPFPGPLGPYTVSGRNIFIAMYALRDYIGQSGLAPASGPLTAPAPLSGFYNLKNVKPAVFTPAGKTGVSIVMTSEIGFGAAPLVQISPGFQPARTRYKGPWITASNQAATMPPNTSTIFDFEDLVADARYFMRVKAVADDAPGRISPEYIVNAIAVTNP